MKSIMMNINGGSYIIKCAVWPGMVSCSNRWNSCRSKTYQADLQWTLEGSWV